MTGAPQNSGVRSWINQHRLASFVGIAYSFTWVIQGALLVSGMEASWTQSILIGFGGFGSPVGAAVVIWASGGDLRKWVGQFFHWRIGAKWWLLALGVPLVILTAGSLLFVALGGPVDLSDFPFPGIYLFALAWTPSGRRAGGTGLARVHAPAPAGEVQCPGRKRRRRRRVGGLAPAAVPQRDHDARQLAALLATALGRLDLGRVDPLDLDANSTGGSVLAVAVFHAGVNAMGIFHPADLEALAPGGVPDTWLNLLAEVTGAVRMVLLALAIVAPSGAQRLSSHEPPGLEVVGPGDGNRSNAGE